VIDQRNLIEQLIREGTKWVATERDFHRPRGRSLFANERDSFARFFNSAQLDKVRITNVPMIIDPLFYLNLPIELRQGLIKFSNMAGITFGDTILISQSKSQGMQFDKLLFHELVHVVQYEILGIAEFIREYVHGWNDNEHDYWKIPLEKNARDLEEKFVLFPSAPFSVTDEVSKALKS